ncbi:MAG: PilZ domain-containing protein [Bdellovibrionales bacterium]|nr:PilZ domain-containing protein [Bdellovibrionales bacterium]
MRHNVVLVGKEGFETEKVRTLLAKNPLYAIEVFSTSQAALGRLMSGGFELLVLTIDVFTKEKLKLPQQLRALGKDFALLILARVISPDVISEIESIPRTLVLETPVDEKRFWGIVGKLAQGSNVRQQRHRRFFTNQEIEVEPLTRMGMSYRGNVYNLSRGGAYIEVPEGNLTVGDLVRFSVQLNELSKKYVVHGKVVWSTDRGSHAGNPGMGVAFMNSGDIYQNLLRKL